MAQNEYFKTIFELDGKQAKAELEAMEQKSEDLYKSLKKAREANDLKLAEKLKKDLNSVDQDIAKYKKNIVDVKKTLDNLNGASLNELNAAQKKISAEFSKMKRGTDEYVAASKKLKEVDAEIKKVRSEMRSAQVQQQSWTSKAAEGFNKYFGVVTAGLAAFGGFVLSIKNVLTSNAKLDDSLADIRKTTGMTTEEVKNLNDQLGKINTRTSREELRQIAVVAGQLGISKDQVLGFTNAVDKLNVALGDEFQGGAEQVSKEMGTLRNVFTDIKSDNVAEDMLHIGNAINELGASGFATGPVMADFSNRIGGVGISLGLTTSQVLGMSATLQELNVNAERGGTAVSKIMQKMTTDTDKFAAVAGMDVKEFTKLVNTDLYGAFIKVVEGSQKSGSSATAMGKILDELGVDGAGAAEVFTKLGKNTGLLQEKVDLANTSLKGTNSIMNEFNTKNETLGAKMEKIGKVLQSAFVSSGVKEALVTIVDKIYEWVSVPLSQSMEEERMSANALAIQLMNTNLPAEDRNRIYGELQTIAPKVLEGIDKENISTQQLAANLRAYNNEMINKIILQQKQEEIDKQAKVTAEERMNYLKSQTALSRQLIEVQKELAGKDPALGKKAQNILEGNMSLGAKAQATRSLMVDNGYSSTTNIGGGGQFGGTSQQETSMGKLERLTGGYYANIKAANTEELIGIRLQEEKLQLMKQLNVEQNAPAAGTNPGTKPTPSGGGTAKAGLSDEQKKLLEAQHKARLELINEGITEREKEYGRYREHLQKLGLMDEKYVAKKGKLSDEEKEAQRIALELHFKNMDEIEKKDADTNLKDKKAQAKIAENIMTEAHQRELDKLELAENDKLIAEGKTQADRERIHNEFNEKREARELAFLLTLKKLYEDAGLDTVNIDKRISKERLAQYERGNKELEAQLKLKEELINKYGNGGKEGPNLDQQESDELAKLDAAYSGKLEKDQQYYDLRFAIEEEFAQKRRDELENDLNEYASHIEEKKLLVSNLSEAVTGAKDLELEQLKTLSERENKEFESTVTKKYNADVKALEKAHKAKKISDEAYEKKKSALDANYANAKTALETKQAAAELKIKKDYADKEFALKVSTIIADTAVSAIRSYSAMAGIPYVGPVLGGIAAAAAIASGAIQIGIAREQYAQVKQLAKGKYDVVGAEDGKKYKDVPLVKNVQSGLISSPTLMAEEPEIALSIKDTQFAMVNYPQIIGDIKLLREGKVPQRAEGKYDVLEKQPATASIDLSDLKAMIESNTAFLQKLYENGVDARIFFGPKEIIDLGKEQKKITDIEKEASRY